MSAIVSDTFTSVLHTHTHIHTYIHTYTHAYTYTHIHTHIHAFNTNTHTVRYLGLTLTPTLTKSDILVLL